MLDTVQNLWPALLANILICFVSIIGVFTLGVNKTKIHHVLIYVIAFAAGTMISSAFFHLIPESMQYLSLVPLLIMITVAIIIFFILEKLLHWHHHHDFENEYHTVGYMNLFADAIHNYLDGMIIITAFILDSKLGLVTSVAVLMHEIPQEIGDFGVLIHSGFTVKNALTFNFMISLVSFLGLFTGYLWSETFSFVIPYVTAFAAGGFLYIAIADLIPEIKAKLKSKNDYIWVAGSFISGILLMFIL